MKKCFIALFMVVALLANAQEHLTFKGVEINGSAVDFISNLTKKGCKAEDYFTEIKVTANFAGLEVQVYLQTTSQSQTVYSVTACSSAFKEEAVMNAQYDELKGLLSNKYGEGKVTTLKDGYFLNVVGEPEKGVAYKPLLFETEKGKIYLYVHKSDQTFLEAGSINIMYVDRINEQLKMAEANMDI